ncbi:Hypothetical predicted protein, partial [Pelobates cultripes]
WKKLFHPEAPLTALQAVNPTIPLARWTRLGISQIHKMCNGQQVMDFPDIQAKWGIPGKDIFPYLQLKHTITAHVQTESLTIPATKIAARLIPHKCWTAPLKPKALSLCYK